MMVDLIDCRRLMTIFKLTVSTHCKAQISEALQRYLAGASAVYGNKGNFKMEQNDLINVRQSPIVSNQQFSKEKNQLRVKIRFKKVEEGVQLRSKSSV